MNKSMKIINKVKMLNESKRGTSLDEKNTKITLQNDGSLRRSLPGCEQGVMNLLMNNPDVKIDSYAYDDGTSAIFVMKYKGKKVRLTVTDDEWTLESTLPDADNEFLKNKLTRRI